ncbi:hypothetical protein AYK24_04560 [Thermoplasmatales archaeon SG8-52-4]|nr:MAG: hypothetical protein AYK24_04560 [Thermoplasmatales archaeon SG8-52-4]
MKKLLILGVIALFIGLAFIPSFNAVSIKKEIERSNDKSDYINITAIAVDADLFHLYISYIMVPVKIRLTSKYGFYDKVKWTSRGSVTFYNVWKEYELTIKEESKYFSTVFIEWRSETKVYLGLRWKIKPRNIDYTTQEQIQNVLSFNNVTSNNIDDCIECQSDDRPICELLLKYGKYFDNLRYYYFNLSLYNPDNLILSLVFIIYSTITINIFTIGAILKCWDNPFYP